MIEELIQGGNQETLNDVWNRGTKKGEKVEIFGENLNEEMQNVENQELKEDHPIIDVSFKEMISEKLKGELLNRENLGMNEELILEELKGEK